jgi:hypothetical protein
MGAVVRHNGSTLRHFSCSDWGCDNGYDRNREKSDRHDSEGSLDYIADRVGERQIDPTMTLGIVDGCIVFHIDCRCCGKLGFPLHKKLEVSTKAEFGVFILARNLGFPAVVSMEA